LNYREEHLFLFTRDHVERVLHILNGFWVAAPSPIKVWQAKWSVLDCWEKIAWVQP
jgi:hypothetical protein